LTGLIKVKFGIVITDSLTGYKLYPRSIFENWVPKTSGFETDHEITCHLVKNKYQIFEVPIRYYPRSRSEGKKIGMTDAVKAVKIFAKRESP
jgi:hypothetical protein